MLFRSGWGPAFACSFRLHTLDFAVPGRHGKLGFRGKYSGSGIWCLEYFYTPIHRPLLPVFPHLLFPLDSGHWTLDSLYGVEMIDTTVDLGRGLAIKNPVMTASGTFGYGEEASAYFDLSELGAVVAKGISLLSMEGNPPPRIVETPAGMLNSIGLQNVGVERFVADKLPFLVESGAVIIANILGGSIGEYVRVAERLTGTDGVSALEVNISCPNVKEGGVQFGMRPELAAELVAALRSATGLHLMVKLSPNSGDIPEMARAVRDAGADSISLINTVTGMEIDIRTRSPVLGRVIGGLSGPAIRPIALRMVYEAALAVDIPVVGIGGIGDPENAIKFLIAGASAVQVGTATFTDPSAPMRIVRGVRSFMEGQGMHSLGQVVGSLVVDDP